MLVLLNYHAIDYYLPVYLVVGYKPLKSCTHFTDLTLTSRLANDYDLIIINHMYIVYSSNYVTYRIKVQ